MGWLKRFLEISISKSREKSREIYEDDVEDRDGNYTDSDAHHNSKDGTEDSTKCREDESDGEYGDSAFSEEGVEEEYGQSTGARSENDEGCVEFQSSEEEDEPVFNIRRPNSFIESPARLHGTETSCQPFPLPFYPDNRDTSWYPESIQFFGFDIEPNTNHEFLVYGDYSIQNSQYDHVRCDVCWKTIALDESGEDPFWQQKYCLVHGKNGTPRCYSCKRLKAGGTTYVRLDGRMLCQDCLGTAIMDTRGCQPLYLEIQQFYESLDMKFGPHVPLYVVETRVFNEAVRREKGENDHARSPGRLLGVTIARPKSIDAIVEKPKISADNEIIEVKSERFRLVTAPSVKVILIWYGFPRLYTGEIIAHEMMHAWLRFHDITSAKPRVAGYYDLGSEVEEGLCQVMAHKWLDSQIYSMSRSHRAPSPQSEFEKKYARFRQRNIESRQDSPYGTGFQLVRRAEVVHGLKGTLDFIRMTGRFPG